MNFLSTKAWLIYLILAVAAGFILLIDGVVPSGSETVVLNVWYVGVVITALGLLGSFVWNTFQTARRALKEDAEAGTIKNLKAGLGFGIFLWPFIAAFVSFLLYRPSSPPNSVDLFIFTNSLILGPAITFVCLTLSVYWMKNKKLERNILYVPYLYALLNVVLLFTFSTIGIFG